MPLLGMCAAVASLLLPSTLNAPLSRRAALRQATGAAVFGAALPASADEPAFSKLGGLLEPYIDTQRGYKLYKPSGWNQFDADPGVYDVKFQDIIETDTVVQVSSSPVQTATSVTALGELEAVGKKFAKSRNAQLISAKQRDAGGSLIYTFELKGEVYHERASPPLPHARACARAVLARKRAAARTLSCASHEPCDTQSSRFRSTAASSSA